VKRYSKTFTATLTDTLRQQLLQWAQQYDEVAWLDSNEHVQTHGTYSAILAVDAFTALKTDADKAFEKLDEYQTITKDWLFGSLSYDLKNDVEALTSKNIDGLEFPQLYFFQPKKVFLFSQTAVTLSYLNMVDDELQEDWDAILATHVTQKTISKQPIQVLARTSKGSYLKKVATMLQHIKRGDIYEANFCQEFFSEGVTLDPTAAFCKLNELSTPPFATFLKLEQQYVLSASPERYLKKEGTQIVSQPIKGTAKRAVSPKEDAALMLQLQQDPKERSENIMITDLVRNDLSRVAKKGTVAVQELCKIYTFEQVHQMISTIVCEVPESIRPVEIIKKTYPMGSMTGAPKVSAMKIIEKLEDARRGAYSGAVGYFTPSGDFDFNVVIRSILYNAASQYVSFSVGGAITAKSIPEAEYQECLLKAKAMRQVLAQ
jgi:para-aminobenzoate synthetase component 1